MDLTRIIHAGSLMVVILLTGCTSIGSLSLIARSDADVARLFQSGQTVEKLGPVEATACRHFILAIVPFGNADVSKAVDKALAGTKGNALINVTTATSLYGFIPVYNVYSFSCTTVRGTAILIP